MNVVDVDDARGNGGAGAAVARFAELAEEKVGGGNGKTGIPDGVAKTKPGTAVVEGTPARVLEATSGATCVCPPVLTTRGKRVLEASRGVSRRADAGGKSTPAEDGGVPTEKGEVA